MPFERKRKLEAISDDTLEEESTKRLPPIQYRNGEYIKGDRPNNQGSYEVLRKIYNRLQEYENNISPRLTPKQALFVKHFRQDENQQNYKRSWDKIDIAHNVAIDKIMELFVEILNRPKDYLTGNCYINLERFCDAILSTEGSVMSEHSKLIAAHEEKLTLTRHQMFNFFKKVKSGLLEPSSLLIEANAIVSSLNQCSRNLFPGDAQTNQGIGKSEDPPFFCLTQAGFYAKIPWAKKISDTLKELPEFEEYAPKPAKKIKGQPKEEQRLDGIRTSSVGLQSYPPLYPFSPENKVLLQTIKLLDDIYVKDSVENEPFNQLRELIGQEESSESSFTKLEKHIQFGQEIVRKHDANGGTYETTEMNSSRLQDFEANKGTYKAILDKFDGVKKIMIKMIFDMIDKPNERQSIGLNLCFTAHNLVKQLFPNEMGEHFYYNTQQLVKLMQQDPFDPVLVHNGILLLSNYFDTPHINFDIANNYQMAEYVSGTYAPMTSENQLVFEKMENVRTLAREIALAPASQKNNKILSSFLPLIRELPQQLNMSPESRENFHQEAQKLIELIAANSTNMLETNKAIESLDKYFAASFADNLSSEPENENLIAYASEHSQSHHMEACEDEWKDEDKSEIDDDMQVNTDENDHPSFS